MEEKFKIRIDSFNMPKLVIKKDIIFSFNLLSKGNLEIKSNVKINEKKVDIDTTRFYANMDVLLPFIQTQLDVSKFSGALSGANKIKIDLLKGGIVFSGKNSYENLEIVTKDNESLIKIDSIFLDIPKLSTVEQILQINSLKIDKPIINFELYKKGINLSKILKEGDSKAIVFKTYDVKGIEFTSGTFNFRDSSKKEKFDYKLSNINISTSPIADNIEDLMIDITLQPNNKNSLLKTKLNFKNKKFNDLDADITLKNVKLDEFTHYIKDFVNISNIKGSLNSDLTLKFNSKNKVPYIKVKGMSELSNLSIIDKKKSAEIVNLKLMKVDIEEASIPENRFVINNVEIDRLKLYGYIAKDGNTIALLFPKQPKKIKDKKSGGKKLFLLLKNFNFKKGNIKFSDDTFEKPFNYTIDIPSIVAKNVSTNKDNRNSMYKIDMITNKTGKFSASGNIRVGKNYETDSKFSLSNFNFTDFKQISEKYSNFITNNGILNYEGTLVLKNNVITSENKAKVLGIDIGEKKKILPLGVSINFVLAIIRNGDGEVTFIIPVKGELNNPQFSYRKTIKIALINILTNIAKAPFAFMYSEDGEDNKLLENLDVDILKRDLPKESEKKLRKIAEIIKKKPLLNFEFVQVIDRDNEYEQMVMKKAKYKFYTEKKEITELTEADIVAIENITDLDSEFVAYINAKSLEIPNSDKMDIHKKSEYILGISSMEKAFAELTNARNKFIESKMIELGIDLSKISIRNATTEESGDIINAHYIVKVISSDSQNESPSVSE